MIMISGREGIALLFESEDDLKAMISNLITAHRGKLTDGTPYPLVYAEAHKNVGFAAIQSLIGRLTSVANDRLEVTWTLAKQILGLLPICPTGRDAVLKLKLIEEFPDLAEA